MKILRIIILGALLLLLLPGCQQTGTVTGSVTYRERIALPSEGVVITIKVEDISKVDAPAVTIGEQIIINPGHQVPIPFKIEYIKDKIDSKNTYAIRARIEVNGKLTFTNTSRYQVITYDSPTKDIEIILEKVG